jgi:hypothetical protein
LRQKKSPKRLRRPGSKLLEEVGTHARPAQSFVDLHQPSALRAPQSAELAEFVREIPVMFRYILAAIAALVLLTASLIPDDAYARRGGGGYRGAGGAYRGGAVAVRGPRGGGAVAVRGGRVAGGYRGYGYRGAYGYRPYGVGAAAVGAAAVGAAAAGAYRGSCYDAYGNYVCAGGYRPY